jgi:hypothetical protein
MDGPEKGIHSPGEDKFRARAFGAKIILKPFFLIIGNASCDLWHTLFLKLPARFLSGKSGVQKSTLLPKTAGL